MGLSQYDPGQELSSIDFAAMIGGPLSAIVDAQSKAALSTVDFVKSIGFTPDTEDEITGEITPGEPVYVTFKYPKMITPYVAAVVGLIDALTIVSGGTGYTVGDTLTVKGIALTVSSVDTAGVIQTIAFNDTSGGHTPFSAEASIGGSGSGATFKLTTIDTPATPAEFAQMKLEVPILTMMPIPFIRVEEGTIDFNAKITSMEYRQIGSEFKFSTSTSMDNTNTNTNIGFFGGLNFNKNVNTISLKTSLSYQRNTKEGFKIDKTFHLGVKVKVSQDEMPEGMEKLLGILEDAIVSQPVE
ncbi:MAG: DUF2589 domain-containing protein [Ignavibacteriae bacterium]|nr:DUF2589 domain-containing protein [Ignavibacteriota bacterium]MCB9215196.1 DUF2589 domain-containing protein [Ignavibacteria bacterium]